MGERLYEIEYSTGSGRPHETTKVWADTEEYAVKKARNAAHTTGGSIEHVIEVRDVTPSKSKDQRNFEASNVHGSAKTHRLFGRMR